MPEADEAHRPRGLRAVRLRARLLRGDRARARQVRLFDLQGGRVDRPRAGQADREGTRDRGPDRAGGGVQVRRSRAARAPDADLRPRGGAPAALDAARDGGSGRRPPGTRGRSDQGEGARLEGGRRGRDPGGGQEPDLGHADGVLLALRRPGARGVLRLHPKPGRRWAIADAGGLRRLPPGRRVLRLRRLCSTLQTDPRGLLGAREALCVPCARQRSRACCVAAGTDLEALRRGSRRKGPGRSRPVGAKAETIAPDHRADPRESGRVRCDRAPQDADGQGADVPDEPVGAADALPRVRDLGNRQQ